VFILILVTGVSIWFYQFAANWDDISEPIYSKTLNSVQVPFGRFVLVRGKIGIGAFKLCHRVSRYGFLNGVKYEYWYSAQGDFSPTKSVRGSSTVYERHRVVKVISDNEKVIEDAGGRYNISIGNYLIEWSSSNHIYSQTHTGKNTSIEQTEPFAIAATNWIDIKEIDFTDKSLKWLQTN
jgi:hypothetical protein